MNWLKRKIEEHNNRLSYVDYEEYWAVKDFIFSFLFHVVGLPLLFILTGCHHQVYEILWIGVVYSALMLIWYIWHLLN